MIQEWNVQDKNYIKDTKISIKLMRDVRYKNNVTLFILFGL